MKGFGVHTSMWTMAWDKASGQVSAARSIRFRYSLAVLCPTPRLVAIFRVDNPLA